MTHWEVKPLSNELFHVPLVTHAVPLTAVSLRHRHFIPPTRDPPHCTYSTRHRHSCLPVGFAHDLFQQFYPFSFLSVDGGRIMVDREEARAHAHRSSPTDL